MKPSRSLTSQPKVMISRKIVFNTNESKAVIAVKGCVLFIGGLKNSRTFVNLIKHRDIQRFSSGLFSCNHLLPEKITFQTGNLMVYRWIVAHIAPAESGKNQRHVIHTIGSA